MNETKQYCVTVKVYVWALDASHAADSVIDDLTYLTKCDGGVVGFIHPTAADAVEDTEV